ncbi:MAG: helicase SNF2, partial [Bacilli bacterium]|nr:helicase SNF2 [Bacilli bacterium]
NMAFKSSAKSYSAWRLFQIVFIVSLILDIVAHEPDLMLDDDTVAKAKTDDVDILYFPTGGGKTEAFLGVMIFNLFFDRLRGKECGVTAMLKYPLRLLSVQQVQRVSNILAEAEKIRRKNIPIGENFSLGYFVGEHNTPNSIKEGKKQSIEEMSQSELDEKYKLLDVCPFCGNQDVHVAYDKEKNSLVHICSTSNCSSYGNIPLYMVDEDVYRFLPSVIISTVDKMTAIGLNARFHNLLCGAEYKCPRHGYTDKLKCWETNCDCTKSEYQRVHMKDPAPSLFIQDELHLIKESLGTYDGHYET